MLVYSYKPWPSTARAIFLSPFILILRECTLFHFFSFRHHISFLHFHHLQAVWQLPNGRNMCSQSTMIHFAWQSSGKRAKEHAIETERGKVSTPTLVTNSAITPTANSVPLPLKLIDIIAFLWESDIRASWLHARILTHDTAMVLWGHDMIALALMSLFQQRIVFFQKESVLARAPESWNSDRIMIN